MAKSSFNTGEFIMKNPIISLIVAGGAVYGINRIIVNYKKSKASSVEASEKNPFNYVVYMQNADSEANSKRKRIVSYNSEEALKFAEKLHETWNTFGFDYPEVAQVIIRNMPSKYDFAKVLQAYNNNYGYDYQAKIKEKYNEDNYDKVINVANDLNVKYRTAK